MDNSKLEKMLNNVGDMALKRRARTILTSLDIKDTDQVLDAGGGDGYYTKLVSELTNAPITLYDFDENALNSARKNLAGKDIKILQGGVEKMPFPDNSFDKIILTEVMEHVPDEHAGFKELYRILKPGGLLAMTVPNYNFPFFWDPVNWIMQNIFNHPIKHSIFEDFFAGIWYGHTRLYHVDELRHKLESHKFLVKDMQAVTHYSLPFQHYILNIMARLLYGGKMSNERVEAVSKFETQKEPKRPFIIKVGFWLFNLVDKPNNNVSLSESSVSVFAVVSKK
jgi:ubiquinone/menaquinone biosynthesis C-methylase UbiE